MPQIFGGTQDSGLEKLNVNEKKVASDLWTLGIKIKSAKENNDTSTLQRMYAFLEIYDGLNPGAFYSLVAFRQLHGDVKKPKDTQYEFARQAGGLLRHCGYDIVEGKMVYPDWYSEKQKQQQV